MMMRALAPLLFASLLVPGASADLEVFVPQQVWGDGVPFQIRGIPEGYDVQIKMDGSSLNYDYASFKSPWINRTIEDVTGGFHGWSVRAFGPNDQVLRQNGTVYVEDVSSELGAVVDRKMGNISDRIAATQAQVQALQGQVDVVKQDSNSSMAALSQAVANLSAALEAIEALQMDGIKGLSAEQNQTLSALLGLQSTAGSDLQEIQGVQSATVREAQKASSRGAMASIVGVTAALLILGAAAFLWLQARQSHKETLALLVAAAVRGGVTPDSEELRLALDAVEH